MKLAKRMVKLFRAQIDPMISTKSRLAHIDSDPDLQAMQFQAKVTDEGSAVGVLVMRNKEPELHFVGLTNIQAGKIKLTDEEIKALKQSFTFESLEALEEKPKQLGRPKAV